jgi:hypothetical protein
MAGASSESGRSCLRLLKGRRRPPSHGEGSSQLPVALRRLIAAFKAFGDRVQRLDDDKEDELWVPAGPRHPLGNRRGPVPDELENAGPESRASGMTRSSGSSAGSCGTRAPSAIAGTSW